MKGIKDKNAIKLLPKYDKDLKSSYLKVTKLKDF